MKYFISVLLSLLITTQAPCATFLSFNQYIKQVMENNETLKSSNLRNEASTLKSEEGDHLFAPYLFASSTIQKDKRPPIYVFSATQINTNSYSFGLNQATPTGTKYTLSYNIVYNDIQGLSSITLPTPRYHDSYPKFEITQSLWSDFFGQSSRAKARAKEQASLAAAENESFIVKQLLSQAQLAYLKVAAARKIVSVQKSSLERSQALKEWAERRVKMHLADKTDLYQAEAALSIKKLDLDTAQNDERAAARQFNTLRHLFTDEVSEELEDLTVEQTLAIAAPKKAGIRSDVVAAQLNSEASDALAFASKDSYMPKLEAYASYAMIGRNQDLSESMSKSTSNTNPLWNVGVNFSVPVDVWNTKDITSGYAREREAAFVTYQQKAYEVEREWQDLEKKYDDYRSRLKLVAEAEAAQLQKLNHEKARFNQGRTTTYQVINFEQDYNQTQLARIQSQSMLLSTIVQMKLYEGKVQ